MRTTGLAILAAAGMLALGSSLGGSLGSPAQAGSVPPFKGNDTGGIIAYSLYQQGADIKAMAVDHCASYGKAVKLIGADAQYGGYISFACVWVPPGHPQRPLRAAY